MVSVTEKYGSVATFGSWDDWPNVFEMRDACKKRYATDGEDVEDIIPGFEWPPRKDTVYSTTEIADLDRLEAFAALELDKKQSSLLDFIAFLRSQESVTGQKHLRTYVAEYYQSPTCPRRYVKGIGAQKMSKAARAVCFGGHSLDIGLILICFHSSVWP